MVVEMAVNLTWVFCDGFAEYGGDMVVDNELWDHVVVWVA